jgi:ATP-dependent protease ClpP protease subunit
MPFSPIIRQKLMPAATAKALNIAEPVKGENRLEVRNAAGTEEAEIRMLGSIGASWWDDNGITEKEFRDALDSIPKGTRFKVKWNSEGGSVKEGLGMYDALKDRRDDATSVIAGYALSIASVIPLAAGKVISPRSAIWMVHKAWAHASGNSDDMQRQSEMLKTHDSSLADIYAAHTGKSKEECMSKMTAETWLTGEEAVAFGLADETDADDDAQNKSEQVASGRAFIPQAYLDKCKNLSPEILNAIKGVLPAASIPAPAKQEAGAVNNDNPEDNMPREQIIALLKSRGITVADKATDAEIMALLQTELAKPVAAASAATNDKPSADVVALQKAIDDLKAQNAKIEEANNAERTKRVTARVDALIAECRVTKEEREKALARSLKDESYLDELAARPVASFGAPGLGFAHAAVGAESSVDRVFAEKDSGKRLALIKVDWENLIRDAIVRDSRGETFRGGNPYAPKDLLARGMPVAANTYSATLVTSWLAEGCVTPLQHRLASLRAFTRDFGTDRYKPLATAQVKKATGAPTTKTNATDFEADSDSTVTNAPITVAQYTQPFKVSNSDLNNGLRLQDLIEINVATFGNKIMQVATADITEANFANYAGGSYISAPAAFGWSDMGLIWGALKKALRKHAILDGEYIAPLLNSPGSFQPGLDGSANAVARSYGWDGVHLNTEWSGAGAGCRGFACDPQAIGAASGLPLTPTSPGIPGGILQESTVSLPELGITVAIYVWFSTSARTLFVSYDVMFGAAKLDTTAGIFIKAA